MDKLTGPKIPLELKFRAATAVSVVAGSDRT